jgi:hypothetical protein
MRSLRAVDALVEDSGSAYVVYGAGGDPADFDLVDIGFGAAARAVWIDGAAAFDSAGWSVAAAGDFNGDGRDDVVVGAPLTDNALLQSGSAYVVYGAAGDVADFDLADIGGAAAGRGMWIDGAAAFDSAGRSVGGSRDLNGADSGSAYVVHGAAGDAADFDLADILGSAAARGLRLDGAAAGDMAGSSVSAAGDIDGDGRADAIVGAPFTDNNGRHRSGSAYIPELWRSLTVATPGAGSGSVAGPGIDCGVDCTETYYHDTIVGLSAIPTGGSSFAWGGDCSGSLACNLTMDEDRTVLATFTAAPGSGGGGPGSGGGGSPGGGGGDGTVPAPAAFGARTLVTLTLAAKRIPAKGPLKARVANGNSFEITGRLSAGTVTRVSGERKRRIKLKAKSFSVGASANRSVALKLQKVLRRVLQRDGKLALRLAAKVTDPAGTTRTVRKKVTPKLKRKRRRH